jgi:hypothetical protein
MDWPAAERCAGFFYSASSFATTISTETPAHPEWRVTDAGSDEQMPVVSPQNTAVSPAASGDIVRVKQCSARSTH